MKEKIKALLGKIKLFFIEAHDYNPCKWLNIDIYFYQFGAGLVIELLPNRKVVIAVAVWFLTVAFIIPIRKK